RQRQPVRRAVALPGRRLPVRAVRGRGARDDAALRDGGGGRAGGSATSDRDRARNAAPRRLNGDAPFTRVWPDLNGRAVSLAPCQVVPGAAAPSGGADNRRTQ